MIKKLFTFYWTPTYFTVLLTCLAWIWISASPESGTTNGSIQEPRQGFLAPEFTLRNEQGEQVSIENLKGKAIIVNFWASWCPPCRAEMPALESVSQDYSKKELVILAINATNQDNFLNIQEFLQENNITFSILLDEDGAVNRLFKISALPTTFFIDSDGIIQDVVIGGPMSEALLRSRVEQLLEE